MRFLLVFALICAFLGESRATTMQQDSIPKRGLGITFGFLNTRFYYDSTEIREAGLQQKLVNFDKKMLKSYNISQLVAGLGGLSLTLSGGAFLATATDGIFATIEKREGYQNAWQLPTMCVFSGLASLLAMNGGKKSARNVLNKYNAAKGLTDSKPNIIVAPASSGIGVAIRF
jgi:hypothetical protein